MRHRLASHRLSLAFALFALLCLLMPMAGAPAPAAAQGTLTFTSSTVAAGQAVIAVGCSFPTTMTTATTSITIGSTAVAATNVASTGVTGCYSITFTVPTSLAAGSYTVNISSGGATDSGTLIVSSTSTGTLTFQPNPATAGQGVTAIGCGFPSTTGTSTVSVSISGYGSVGATGVTTLGGSGCYSIAFTVPATLVAGSYTVSITSGTVTQTGSLSVNTSTTNSLTFTPSTAVAGQAVTAFGCGFPSSTSTATVSIVIGGYAPSAISVAASGAAGCYNITFVVPSVLATGTTYAVTITSGNVTDTGTLAVGSSSAVLTFTPNPVASGQSVTAYGCGFPSSTSTSTVSITIGSTTLTATGVAATGTSGCYNITFVVPTLAAASYTVTITVGSTTISGTLAVNTGAATLTLTPSVAADGALVAANGCGYSGGETLGVTIYSSTTLLAAPTLATQPVYTGSGTNSSACYSVSFIVPSLANGTYTVRLTGATSGNVDTGTLTVVATMSGASLAAAPSTVVAGTSITLTGAGFTSGAQVTITAFGASQTVTATGGNVIATLTVPSGTAAGTYTITAVDTSGRSASVTVTVSAPSGTLTPSVTSAYPGQVVTVTGTGFAPNEQVSLSLAAPSSTPFAISGTTQLYTANSAGTISGVQYTVPNITAGSYLLLALGQTSRVLLTTPFSVLSTTPTPTSTPIVAPTATPTATSTPLPLPALPAVSTAATTTYFASGYTGTAGVNGKVTFTVRLFFYNPGPAASIVTTTYAVYNSTTRTTTTVVKQETVGAGATASRLVNLDVGNDRIVSAVVRSTSGIVAEEVSYRTRSDGTVLDTDSSLGSSKLSTTWYLAEGYTGESLQEYITLYNPGTTPAHAQVQYLPTGGTPAPAPQAETVPPNSQVTINVRSQYNALVPKGSRNIAAVVTSDLPIAVDRAMYWGDGSGSAKYGYSLAPAIAAGTQRQYFALLPTAGGSQSFITVLNPGAGAANVSLSLLSSSGTTLKTASANIPAHARYTFVVPTLLPGNYGNLSGGLLSSNEPVVAEAALYFGGSPNIGSHPGTLTQGSAGAQIAARADVNTRGGLLRVFNPGTSAARVQVTLGSIAGSGVVFDGMVPAGTAREIALPGSGGVRGVLVRASGNVVATLINGGLGATQVWGGSLG